MKEYDKFEKGSANGSKNTEELSKRLTSELNDEKIVITTIQKLNIFVTKNVKHDIYNKKVVLIFDECHRSQFGQYHENITKKFKNYFIFGFTGTPIFAENANKSNIHVKTTEQVFGKMLHSYTIIDAINDDNVLPFRVDYVNTMKMNNEIEECKVSKILTNDALHSKERINLIAKYILEHFDQQTKRNEAYILLEEKRIKGFNSIFCVDSIESAKKYYLEFKKLQSNRKEEEKLKIATIFSYSANEEMQDSL
jgi:type I restriction enzyme R subunit